MRTRLKPPIGRAPGPRGDCGVVALAIVTGASYPDVWKWFWSRSRNDFDAKWEGETYHEDYAHCARAFGVRLKKLRKGIGMTVAAWSEYHANDGGVYLVCSPDHAGVLCDGVYADNSRIGPLYDRAGVSRCRVTDVWIVLPA